MGRKLNVALLLTVHLSFIACAVLIVSPLNERSDQVDQRVDGTITANEFEPFMQVSTYTKEQKSMKGLQQRATDRQHRFSQRLKDRWKRADGGLRERQ